jgi:acetyl esterase/lipase
MTTRSMVDPELLPMLDSIVMGELSLDILGPAREHMKGMIEPEEAYANPDVAVEHRTVPGPKGAPDVRVSIYRPKHAKGPLPAYLNIHGGGYIMASPAFYGRGNTALALDLGCVIVAVDYRLAPEAVAPAAVEDCYAALAWIHDNAKNLGIDPTRVAIGGDSAGGGLTASLALLARDRGKYPVCFQVLIYPMLDDRTSQRAQQNPHIGEFIWDRPNNNFGWRAYLGHDVGKADVSIYHVPGRATELAGLPPAYVSVGALDLFLEEDVD